MAAILFFFLGLRPGKRGRGRSSHIVRSAPQAVFYIEYNNNLL